MYCKPMILVAAFASSMAVAQTIERPTVKVGDECVYEVFDNFKTDASGNPEKVAERKSVVKSISGDRITIDWSHKMLVSRQFDDIEAGTFVYDKDLNLLERNGRTFDPPYPLRFYPLTAGAERNDVKTRYPRATRDGETTAKLDGKAGKWAKVTVPAGTFDTVPITWEGFYDSKRGNQTLNGRLYQQLSISPATYCFVSGVFRLVRSPGGIWYDITYKLTASKS